jgi:flagellar protein FliJ
MKRFKFKFSVLLDTRKKVENLALSVYSDKQRLYRFELIKKAKLVSELQAALTRRESLGSQPVTAAAFKSEQEFIEGLKQKIIQADHAIFKSNREVEKSFRRYLDAKKKTRTIELIYEKDHAAFKKALLKKLQKDLDEMIIFKYQPQEESL